jgi:hypothetical protein
MEAPRVVAHTQTRSSRAADGRGVSRHHDEREGTLRTGVERRFPHELVPSCRGRRGCPPACGNERICAPKHLLRGVAIVRAHGHREPRAGLRDARAHRRAPAAKDLHLRATAAAPRIVRPTALADHEKLNSSEFRGRGASATRSPRRSGPRPSTRDGSVTRGSRERKSNPGRRSLRRREANGRRGLRRARRIPT